MLILLEKGRQSLTYLGYATQSENGALIPQLTALEKAGILHNDWHDQKNAAGEDFSRPVGEYSFFDVTPFGKQLIDVIATSLSSARLGLLKALGNPLRFALVRYMIEKGPVSFSGVATITGLQKSAVASHLRKLEAGGLVEKSFSRDKHSGDYSIYAATRAASDIIPRLLLLEQYRDLSTRAMNLMVQDKVLKSLRETIMGAAPSTDAEFFDQILGMERSIVDALLAAENPEEKRTHAKQLANTCDALKKYAETFLES